MRELFSSATVVQMSAGTGVHFVPFPLVSDGRGVSKGIPHDKAQLCQVVGDDSEVGVQGRRDDAAIWKGSCHTSVFPEVNAAIHFC